MLVCKAISAKGNVTSKQRHGSKVKDIACGNYAANFYYWLKPYPQTLPMALVTLTTNTMATNMPEDVPICLFLMLKLILTIPKNCVDSANVTYYSRGWSYKILKGFCALHTSWLIN